VKTERAIVERLGGKFEESGLRSDRYAIVAFIQILLGQAGLPQQESRVNIVIPKRGNRPSRGESSRRWQQAGDPAVGASMLHFGLV
jgi:hypothetical protein